MDQERFKKEVIPLRGRLSTLSARMLDDDQEAQDVVQEILLKLWAMRTRLDELGSIPAFAVRMTKNACLNRLRARKRSTPVTEQIAAEALSPHRQLENKENLERTIRIIDALPPVQRAILRMKHIDGLEVEEIVALTGSNSDAVRMNLSRARRAVKERFMKSDNGTV